MNKEPRIVVITGANSGIGRAATERFAAEGYHVVMACRSTERAVPVREAIVRQTGVSTIDLIELDTSSRESIESFVTVFSGTYPRLDILINNAAYFNHGEPYRVNRDRMEIAFATNVVGPYLLITLLQEHLRRSEDPRVLNVGSNIIKHYFSPKMAVDLSDLGWNATDDDGAAGPTGAVGSAGVAGSIGASGSIGATGTAGTADAADATDASVYRRYCRSKLALLMLTLALSEELRPHGIAVNYLQVNGAKLSKETVRKFSRGYRVVGRLQSLFLKPPEFMAERYFRITTGSEFRGVTGRNINHHLEIMRPAPTTTSEGKPLRVTDEIKITIGTDFYPAIADNQDLQAAVMQICRNARDLSGVQNEDAAERNGSDNARSLVHRHSESYKTVGRKGI